MPGRVKVLPLGLATDHPLGSLAQGEGWAIELGAEAATVDIQIVHLGSGGESHVRRGSRSPRMPSRR